MGVLSLLGNRVPLGVKVFLTALAIVDDMGAVLVIAVFYTTDINFTALGIGVFSLLVAAALNKLDVRHPMAYLTVGFVVWVCFLKSGIHATIAAILVSFLVPATTRINGSDLLARVEIIAARLKEIGLPQDTRLNTEEQQQAIFAMHETIDHAQAPLQRIEHDLHGPVTFFVLPVFALANAGVTLEGDLLDEMMSPISVGIIVGLLFGKQIGITLATFIAVKLRLADLPEGVTWRQIHGANILAGIGFTMSLFVAGLAFSDPIHIAESKIGILMGSLLSAVLGCLFILKSPRPIPKSPIPKS